MSFWSNLRDVTRGNMREMVRNPQCSVTEWERSRAVMIRLQPLRLRVVRNTRSSSQSIVKDPDTTTASYTFSMLFKTTS